MIEDTPRSVTMSLLPGAPDPLMMLALASFPCSAWLTLELETWANVSGIACYAATLLLLGVHTWRRASRGMPPASRVASAVAAIPWAALIGAAWRVSAHAFSATAREKITAAGGTVTQL